MNKKTNVLYVHYGNEWIRGSEKCLIHLVDGLDHERYSAVVWTNNTILHQHLIENGYSSYCSDFPLLLGWHSPRWRVDLWWKLIQSGIALVKTHRIDLIHNNSAAPCQWMNFVARKCNIPAITHLHSEYLLRDRLTLGIHLCNRIVCVSDAVAKNMLADGYDIDKITTVYNGIPDTTNDTETISIKKTLNIPDNRGLFATVASLISTKGVDRIIRSIAAINDSGEACDLVIIGSGPDRKLLQSLGRQLKVEQHIHFMGEQKMPFSLLKYDINGFVSGSLHEAFGLVIAEAALTKLPIIAPAIGGIPEIVSHNHSALLYDAENPIKSMVQHMKCLLNSPELASKLAANAYARVKNHFSLEQYIDHFDEIYQQQLIHQNNLATHSLISAFKPIKKISFRHFKGHL